MSHLFAKDQGASSYSTTPWSIRMAQSEMKRNPNKYTAGSGGKIWDYVNGTVLQGFAEIWSSQTTDTTSMYFQYIQHSVDNALNSNGTIKSPYSFMAYTLDNINEGRMLPFLYTYKGALNYKIAADTLRKQLSQQPRTSEGGFWHKLTYPNQMWLDGIYMASPFYAEYGKVFSDTGAYSDVLKQLTLITQHTQDSMKHLLYHGWDETKTMAWADKSSGTSKTFWGRAMGWYAMALVDVLDDLPSNYFGRSVIISELQNLAVGLKTYQDASTGTWWQVVDQGARAGNYRESSASCMFVYALAKGVRKGYLSQDYLEVAKRGYVGLLNNFININTDSTININNICQSASLVKTTTDTTAGSYAYYIGTPVATNEGKGTGTFMMASVELERIGFVVPPLNVHSTVSNDSVFFTWTDKTYNAVTFRIERKSDSDSQFTEIGNIPKGVASYIDHPAIKGLQYFYRIRAKSETDSSDYSAIESVTIPVGTFVHETIAPIGTFELQQNYPNPFNPTTQIHFSVQERNWTSLKVFDVLGREINILYNSTAEPGVMYNIRFDASHLANGLYLCVLQCGQRSSAKKMLLLK
jgi:unsaturated rhamnogalacturonyl hydrolase